MPCRIYKLDFQDLEIRGSNPGESSNFSLENQICTILLVVIGWYHTEFSRW